MAKGKITKPDAPTEANVLMHDACIIIEQAQQSAYRTVNETLIKRNWLLGMRIQHEVLKEQRAEYGEQIIKSLAKSLTERYGTGYSRNNLYRFVSFFKSFPNLFLSVQISSGIIPAVTGQSGIIPSAPGFLGFKNNTDYTESALEQSIREIEHQKEFFRLQNE